MLEHASYHKHLKKIKTEDVTGGGAVGGGGSSKQSLSLNDYRLSKRQHHELEETSHHNKHIKLEHQNHSNSINKYITPHESPPPPPPPL